MQDIDKEIIFRAGRGDMAAFEDVFKAYSSLIYNVALRMVYVEQDAKDITQEVFMILYRKLAEFKFESTLKTWVYRITVNQSLNYLKRHRRIKETKDETILESFSDPSADSADIVANRELIELSLGRLTPEQRACVVLRAIEGLAYADIAQALGVDINVVRSRLKRAREKLAEFKQEVGIL